MMSEGEITDSCLSDAMSDISATSNVCVKEEAPQIEDKPMPWSSTPVSVKTEVQNDPESQTFSSARKASAIEVELELLRPMWRAAIRVENQGATENQLATLIEEKLEEVGQMIRLRSKAEKKFKDDCLMMCQIHENLTQILKNLKLKDLDDPSVRIENYQANLLIKDWESVRLPIFETDYQEASRFWFKPHADPLVEDFSSIMNKFANLIAQLEYERSIRPVISDQTAKDDGINQAIVKDVQSCNQPRMKPQFVTPKLIKPFVGDVSDPKVMAKFGKWKSSWMNLAQEIQSTPGSNSTILFKKLKACLSGPALDLVHKYPSDAQTSYDLALGDLIDKYDDPSKVVGYCIMNGIDPRQSDSEHLGAIKQSMSAMRNIRNVVETEKVDMYNFALINAFIMAMTPDMQAKWNEYKSEKKRGYERIRESALQMGKTLPVWVAGMVENFEHFNAWLSLQREEEAQKNRQSSNHRDSKPSCFVCGPSRSDHPISRCQVVYGMSFNEWQDVCRKNLACAKCTQPLEYGHVCNTKCRICLGKRREVDHHVLMCPLSKYRTAPLHQDQTATSRSTPQRIHKNHKRPALVPLADSRVGKRRSKPESKQNHSNDIEDWSTRDDNSSYSSRDRYSRSGRDRTSLHGGHFSK